MMETIFKQLFLAWAFLILSFNCNFANCQNNPQNSSAVALPYPYQTALGLPPGYGMPQSQNIGISASPFPYQGNNNWTAVGIPNISDYYKNYYAVLAQMGIPAYQYYPGMNGPQPGPGYTQASWGYPPSGPGYTQPSWGYPPSGPGYTQPSWGYPPSGPGYPQSTVKYAYLAHVETCKKGFVSIGNRCFRAW